MKMELPEIRPEERTPLVEALLAITRELLDRNQQLEETIVRLRDEIAILKGKSPDHRLNPVVSSLPRHRPSRKFHKKKSPSSVPARRNAPRTAN